MTDVTCDRWGFRLNFVAAAIYMLALLLGLLASGRPPSEGTRHVSPRTQPPLAAQAIRTSNLAVR